MPVEFKDYYATLGVPRDATDADIKRAFRKLARQHHPDVARDKKTAEERFKEINEAYEVLGDPAKRRQYDRLGARWQRDPGAEPFSDTSAPGTGSGPSGGFEFRFGGTGFSDFFERFFGGTGAFEQAFRRDPTGTDARDPFGYSHRRAAVRGADVQGDILVTLDEVRRGSIRNLSLQRTDPRTGQTGTHAFKVRIPPGVQDGQTIRVPGKGAEGTDGAPPGDLYLHVRLAAHPDFRPHGSDLYHDLDLAPWDAVLGTTLRVPTPDGPVTLRIPPGTQNGQQLRLRGRGLPRGATGRRGDLFVVVNLLVPENPTPAERALWEKLRQSSGFHPDP